MAESKVPLSDKPFSYFEDLTKRVTKKAVNDDETGALMETRVDAEEFRKRSPLVLLGVLRKAEGDNLAEYPLPGSTSDTIMGNAKYYDKFKVKSGERTRTSSFYELMAVEFPYGSDAYANVSIIDEIDALKAQVHQVPNPYKDDQMRRILWDQYKAMTAGDRDSERSKYSQRITTMAGALREAVSLYHVLAAIQGIQSVRLVIRNGRKDKDGETKYPTYPFGIVKTADPDHYQNYTPKTILRLKPQMLDATTATYEELIATAGRDSGDDTEEKDAPGNIKSLPSLIGSMRSIASFVRDQENFAAMRKYLNSKDPRTSEEFAFNLYLFYTALSGIMEKGGGLERGEAIEQKRQKTDDADAEAATG